MMDELAIKRVLFGAKFLLAEGTKWRKGQPFSEFMATSYCLMQAIEISAKKLYPDRLEAYRIISIYMMSVIKDLGYEAINPIAFNDDKKTIWANVAEVLDSAIDRIKPLQVSE
jgi:hypothetical protein